MSRPAVTADQILTALAELLAPKIAELLAADAAVSRKPPAKRRRAAIRCDLKPPEHAPTELEAAKARAVLRSMGIKNR